METFTKLLQGYGDNILSSAMIFKTFKVFSKGRDLIEDELRSGKSSTARSDENVQRIRDLMHSDPRLTVRIIVEELNLTHSTIHQILSDELGNGRNLRKIKWETFPERMTTSDASWVFEWHSETKRLI
ncbi:hypothetical protein Trydic_g8111 [Trypoxylus dichotomus]